MKVTFTGNKIGAIGIQYRITETVDAPDLEYARIILYEKYQHIHLLKEIPN